MSLRADQRDYKNAFKKHYHAYSNWQGTGSNLSRRLILAYCVECGLKYNLRLKSIQRKNIWGLYSFNLYLHNVGLHSP